MRLICNQSANGGHSCDWRLWGGGGGLRVCYLGAKHTKQQGHNLFPFVNITPPSTCSQSWLTVRMSGRHEGHGITLCSFAHEVDYEQYVLTSIFQQKQREQTTLPKALLFLNPSWTLWAWWCPTAKASWAVLEPNTKTSSLGPGASKQQQGQVLYFRFSVVCQAIAAWVPCRLV